MTNLRQDGDDCVNEPFAVGDTIHAIYDLSDANGRTLMLSEADRAIVTMVIPDGHRRILYAVRCTSAQAADRRYRDAVLRCGGDGSPDQIRITWPCLIAKVPRLLETPDQAYAKMRCEDYEYRNVQRGDECSGGCSRDKLTEFEGREMCAMTGRVCPRLDAKCAVQFAERFLEWLEDIET